MAFREDKAAALAAIYLERAGGELEYLKLLKLMYLAERESLCQIGSSITGDIFVSMKLGPVMSMTYDLIKRNWDDIDHATWEGSIQSRPLFRLALKRAPSIDQILSPFEIGLAESTWEKFGAVDRWELVDWIHETFPEWQKTTSAIPIQPEDIYRAVSLDEAEVSSRISLRKSVSEFDRLVSETKTPA